MSCPPAGPQFNVLDPEIAVALLLKLPMRQTAEGGTCDNTTVGQRLQAAVKLFLYGTA